jgi:phosphomannomutase
MIFRLGELYKVPVFETSVGFKNICPIFLKEDVLMAGEESGGFAFRNHVPERDGVLSGLLFLELMVKTNKSASELLKDIYSLVGPHFYKRKDVKVPSHHKEEIKQLVETMRPKEIDGKKILKLDNVDGKRFQFEDGWVALRFSGTEPLIRIYGESSSPRSVSTTIEGLARMIEVT